MKKLCLVVVLLFIGYKANCQNPEKKIDQLFESLNKGKSPGAVVGISKNGQLLLSKAYGKSSIPYNIDNTPETIFNLGSVSKQFTAMGIVLLEQDGKLSFTDDIRKYLPELPDFGKKITINNLLHHTSGLRSTPEFFGLAGWRDGDAITNDDVFRFMQKQKQLNFEPGLMYMYSNTNYVILARIIEVVTNQNFKKWTNDHIFQELKMSNTFIEEDYTMITKSVATSYSEIEQSVFKYIENNDLSYGASNVYSTINDLLIWTKNFHSPSKTWEKSFQKLKTIEVLTNGQKNNYAYGIVLDEYLGNKRVQHTGAIAGFRSVMYSFPEEKIDIIVFINFDSNRLDLIANQIASFYLSDKTKNDEIVKPKIENATVKQEVLSSYTGNYWNDIENYSRKVIFEDNQLWYVRSNNTKSLIIPLNDSVFQMDGIKDDVKIKFSPKSKKMFFITGDKIDTFDKYENTLLDENELNFYTGNFYSEELETTYSIILRNGILYCYHNRFGEFEIQRLKNDVLSWAGMAISKYQRNEKGEITGFLVDLSRVKKVWFRKIN